MAPDYPAGRSYPFWFGTPLDKPIIFLFVLASWLLVIPLLLWVAVRTLLVYALTALVLFLPLSIAAVVGTTLFLITLYWTPASSLALTTFAPLIQAGIIIGVFALNLFWFFMVFGVQTWNEAAPTITVLLIQGVQLILSVVIKVTEELTGADIGALFADLLELVWFFTDIVIIILTELAKALPSMLKIVIKVARPIFQLLLKTIPILQPLLEFLFNDLIKILPPILRSVAKLVRHFRALLRGVTVASALASRVGLSPQLDARYSEGVQVYFNTLVDHGSTVEWDTHATAAESIAAIAYSLPTIASSADIMKPRGLSEPPPQRSLYGRFLSSRVSVVANASNDHHETVRRALTDEAFAGELEDRAMRIEVASRAVVDSLHAAIDVSPSLETHMGNVGAMFSGFSRRAGYRDVWHALDDYKTRFGHPAHVLVAVVPDLYQSEFGRMLAGADAEHPDYGSDTYHAWRRTPSTVTGSPNAHAINRMLVAHMKQRKVQTSPVDVSGYNLPSGTVPFPWELPVIIDANCFSKPKFILCLPEPKPRTFKAPTLLIPVDIVDLSQCKGYVAPPTSWDDAWKMFNPWTAIRNTWATLQYILGAFVDLMFSFNAASVNNPILGAIADLFVIQDPAKGGITTEQLICVFGYLWYPFYLFVLTWGAIFAVLPLLWALWSIIVIFLFPFRVMSRWVRKLINFYAGVDHEARVYRLVSTRDVAKKMYARPQVSAPPSLSFSSAPPAPSLIASSVEDHHVYTALALAEPARRLVQEQYAEEQHLLQEFVRAATDLGLVSPHIYGPADEHRHAWRLSPRLDPGTFDHTTTLSHMFDMLSNIQASLTKKDPIYSIADGP